MSTGAFEDVFAALLEQVREGAAERERRRELPRDLVSALAAAGFGWARVPVAEGGEGVGLDVLFDRLVRLAAADSNVAHLLRGHLAFVEQQFFEPDPERRERWYREVLTGALVGNAQSETGGSSDLSTTLTEVDGVLRLDGRKYYTTGTLYADWVDTSARFGDHDVQVFVSTRAPGVSTVDDWKGFGQRLTGSGTTTYDGVVVRPEDVRHSPESPLRHAYLMGFFQLVLLAVAAGIARAALDDAVAYVRPRSRIFGYAGTALPRENPLVQAVVGRLSSTAHASRAVVLECARALDAALQSHLRGDEDATARAVRAQLDVYRAQQVVLPMVVEATGELFEVGGASAVDVDLALDRHWRNARTLATHNPAIHRARAIGDFELNGTAPAFNAAGPGQSGGAAR